MFVDKSAQYPPILSLRASTIRVKRPLVYSAFRHKQTKLTNLEIWGGQGLQHNCHVNNTNYVTMLLLLFFVVVCFVFLLLLLFFGVFLLITFTFITALVV